MFLIALSYVLAALIGSVCTLVVLHLLPILKAWRADHKF